MYAIRSYYGFDLTLGRLGPDASLVVLALRTEQVQRAELEGDHVVLGAELGAAAAKGAVSYNFV